MWIKLVMKKVHNVNEFDGGQPVHPNQFRCSSISRLQRISKYVLFW